MHAYKLLSIISHATREYINTYYLLSTSRTTGSFWGTAGSAAAGRRSARSPARGAPRTSGWTAPGRSSGSPGSWPSESCLQEYRNDLEDTEQYRTALQYSTVHAFEVVSVCRSTKTTSKTLKSTIYKAPCAFCWAPGGGPTALPKASTPRWRAPLTVCGRGCARAACMAGERARVAGDSGMAEPSGVQRCDERSG